MMTSARLREILFSFTGVEESTPFGPETSVHKIGGKIFAIYSPADEPLRLNLKCDPERAIQLREEYESIIPGYHMNKRHWNTLVLDGMIPPTLVRELIAHSYELVVASLPKKMRDQIGHQGPCEPGPHSPDL